MKTINSTIRLFLFLFCLLCATSCKKEKDEKPLKSGTTGDLTWAIYSDGTLTISGKGKMPDYYDYYSGDPPPPPWTKELVTAVVIKKGVTSIGRIAFSECRNLTSVTIPNSVTSIGEYAFWGCSGLISVTIPNSVTYIGKGAFYYSSLTIVVDNGNTAYSSENGILFNKTKTTLIQYPARKTGAYIIPNSVTFIGHDAFTSCTGLTSVTIPNSVTRVGILAFSECSGLTSVIIPNSVTHIYAEAFWGCSGLTSVTIPNSIMFIDQRVFYGCSSLTEIINQQAIPLLRLYSFDEAGIIYNAFFGTNITDCTLFVPAGSEEAYRAAPVWQDFGKIVAI